MLAAEAKKAQIASDEAQRIPRPPSLMGRLAWSHCSQIIIIIIIINFIIIIINFIIIIINIIIIFYYFFIYNFYYSTR